MQLQIAVNDDGTISDAKFKTFGCGSAIASSSLVTEWIKGKSIDEAIRTDEQNDENDARSRRKKYDAHDGRNARRYAKNVKVRRELSRLFY